MTPLFALAMELTPLHVNALLGGAGIALLCGVLSVFVVLKRMAFIGQGISHAAFGGVGLALLLGLGLAAFRPLGPRNMIIAAFCIAMAIAIGLMARRGKMAEDTAIGIALVAAMSFGLLLMDVRAMLLSRLIASGQLTRGEVAYAPSMHSILFGNIALLPRQEVVMAWVLAGLVLLCVLLAFKELVFFCFDEETATVFGVNTRLVYFGLLVLLGLAIVAAMRSLGVILASALLVLPGAAARPLSHRIGWVSFFSVIISVAGTVTGVWLSILLEGLSPAALIVLVLCALLAGTHLYGGMRSRFLRRRKLAAGG